MSEQPNALRLAYALEHQFPVGAERHCLDRDAATELRRLHSLNAELVEALRLALDAHGLMLLGDPPQEAWKAWSVEAKARTALTKAEGKQ